MNIKYPLIVLLLLILTSSQNLKAKNLIVVESSLASLNIGKELNITDDTNSNKTNKITFRAKKSSLWFKASYDEGNKEKNTIDVSLDGELYNPSRIIPDVEKKHADTAILEKFLASYFSASRNGDLKWIVDSFVDEEKSNVKNIFKNKKILKDSQKEAQGIKANYLKGLVTYKDYTILIIEQKYKNGKTITEAIACKETKKGWRITNNLGSDKTFDIVFAAVSNGEIIKQ